MDPTLDRVAEELANAERRSDVAVLAGTLAEDFIGIGPRGFMLTRDEWLARHKSGDLRYESFELDEVKMRLYGDAAILTRRETTKATYQGREMAGQFRTTQVFVKQNGRWMLASLQLSPIVLPPGPSTTAAGRGSSPP